MRVASITVAVLAALLLSTTPAVACSVGPDFDPRAATDLLIAGRVAGIDIAATTNEAGFRRATVTVAIDAVLRGQASDNVLKFVDDASVTIDPLRGVPLFMGAAGSCGVLDEDPMGRYVVIALKRSNSGELIANRLYGAAFGDGPADPRLRSVLDRHLASLPNTSTAARSSTQSSPASGVGNAEPLLALASFSAAALIAVIALRRRHRRTRPSA